MRSFLQIKNDHARADWYKRMAHTGGANLQDLRNIHQQKAWWIIRKSAWKMKPWAIEARDDMYLRKGIRG